MHTFYNIMKWRWKTCYKVTP